MPAEPSQPTYTITATYYITNSASSNGIAVSQKEFNEVACGDVGDTMCALAEQATDVFTAQGSVCVEIEILPELV